MELLSPRVLPAPERRARSPRPAPPTWSSVTDRCSPSRAGGWPRRSPSAARNRLRRLEQRRRGVRRPGDRGDRPSRSHAHARHPRRAYPPAGRRPGADEAHAQLPKARPQAVPRRRCAGSSLAVPTRSRTAGSRSTSGSRRGWTGCPRRGIWTSFRRGARSSSSTSVVTPPWRTRAPSSRRDHGLHPEPAGGRIERRPGRSQRLLQDNAIGLVASKDPAAHDPGECGRPEAAHREMASRGSPPTWTPRRAPPSGGPGPPRGPRAAPDQAVGRDHGVRRLGGRPGRLLARVESCEPRTAARGSRSAR